MANRRKKKNPPTISKPSQQNPLSLNNGDSSITMINGVSNQNPSSINNGTFKDNPFSIDATSKEKPFYINGTSKDTTNEDALECKDTSFRLKLRRARNLKLAMGALIDSHFNPHGVGRIDVDRKGMEITVWNVETRVIGNLRIQPSYRKCFHYSKPFISKMLNLTHVFHKLVVADDDPVTIYHLHGSTQLFFNFGSDPPTEFSVELVEADAEYEKLPAITLVCAAALPSKHLRQMIPLMVQEGTPQRVLVSTTHKNVTITVGNKECRYKVEESETKVWMRQERQELNGWFQWPHGESLMKASRLSKVFSLCFIDNPRNCFMFRFIDYECCDLAFIKHYDDFTEPPYSKGNQISIDRPPDKKSTYTFKFQLHPAGALKNALQSMTDYDFNGPAGLGMIEVSQFGVDIRVCDSETGVIGLLHLLRSGLINFECNKPFMRKVVNLDYIALNVLLAHDNDLIAVHQVDGSNEISFKSGLHHLRTFPAELLEKINAGFEEFPYEYDITYACEIMIPSRLLREAICITMDENRRPETVSVEIKNKGYFSLSIGQWEWVCDDVNKLFGSETSRLPGQNQQVSFEWRHLVSLKWASFLADWFVFCIVTDPPDRILLRFKLHDFGYLHYMNKTFSTLPNSEHGK